MLSAEWRIGMETKKIIESLLVCLNPCTCNGCAYNVEGKDYSCSEKLLRIAAERLEELERAINDRPYGWISLEDRLPEKRVQVLGYSCTDKHYGLGSFSEYKDIKEYLTHWMHCPNRRSRRSRHLRMCFWKSFRKLPLMKRVFLFVV